MLEEIECVDGDIIVTDNCLYVGEEVVIMDRDSWLTLYDVITERVQEWTS